MSLLYIVSDLRSWLLMASKVDTTLRSVTLRRTPVVITSMAALRRPLS